MLTKFSTPGSPTPLQHPSIFPFRIRSGVLFALTTAKPRSGLNACHCDVCPRDSLVCVATVFDPPVDAFVKGSLNQRFHCLVMHDLVCFPLVLVLSYLSAFSR